MTNKVAAMNRTSLPSEDQETHCLRPSTDRAPADTYPSLNISTDTPKLSQPVSGSGENMTAYNRVFTNWHNYNMNNSVNPDVQYTTFIPTPPSTLPSSSPRSSTTSSPAEPNTQTNQTHTPYFIPNRRRSSSLSIPALTSACPSCGLRRPSNVSDQAIIPSHLNNLPAQSRPHLPLHLHCPDPCPDEAHPTRGPVSPVSPSHKRYHRRRRSSLCYAETLVDDAEIMDSGRLPFDVKTGWERQAENIARKVVSRETSNTDDTFAEAIIEE